MTNEDALIRIQAMHTRSRRRAKDISRNTRLSTATVTHVVNNESADRRALEIAYKAISGRDMVKVDTVTDGVTL